MFTSEHRIITVSVVHHDTISSAGILNGIGSLQMVEMDFESQVDWKDPNIIYSQSQNGGLVRFDKKSGENFLSTTGFCRYSLPFDWDAGYSISRNSITKG